MRDKNTRVYYVCKDLRDYTLRDGQPKEVLIRKHCMPWHHRNLLDFHAWYFVENNPRIGCKLYYEYCAGGDLWRLIPRRGHAAEHPESFIWHVFIQLAKALDAMHNQGPQRVIHRDVKPENVFLKSSYRPNQHSYPTIKLGDYGLATTKLVTDDAGTWEFMGPELHCSAKGDVWALGAVIHALCHGFGPVSKAHSGWKQNPRARRPIGLPSRYSNALNHRMMSCLRADPRDRPGSATLLLKLHSERPSAR